LRGSAGSHQIGNSTPQPTFPLRLRAMSAWVTPLSQGQLLEAKKRLANSPEAFSAGGYGKDRVQRRRGGQQQKGASASSHGPAAPGMKGEAANTPVDMEEDYDTEDETAITTLKQVMNVTQRTRALAGCLISTHLLDKECILNAHAIGAAQQYMAMVEENPSVVLGPPSLMVAMAVMTVLVQQTVVKEAPDIQAEIAGLKSLVERLRTEKIEVAAEYIKHWRAKTTFAKEGEEAKVRHSFYIHAFVPIGDPPNMSIVPANLLITKCLMKMGSEPKPGPPPRGGPGRKLQNSLTRMLKGGKHKKW
ncbi:unnamed protein product, partial [Prorocentrum cordatum]